MQNLSNAMVTWHSTYVPSTLDGCYNYHPGPNTQSLRDVMHNQAGMIYSDCHGTMAQVGTNPNPWLNEPRCDNTACHGSDYALNQPLYRNSTDRYDLYCAGCHDSPHAIAPSSQPADAKKFLRIQGHGGPIDTCSVCHPTTPSVVGHHAGGS